MKRIRTLVLYFFRVPEEQRAAEQQPTPSPPPAPEQQTVQAPPPQSQGTEEGTIRTRASAHKHKTNLWK